MELIPGKTYKISIKEGQILEHPIIGGYSINDEKSYYVIENLKLTVLSNKKKNFFCIYHGKIFRSLTKPIEKEHILQFQFGENIFYVDLASKLERGLIEIEEVS